MKASALSIIPEENKIKLAGFSKISKIRNGFEWNGNADKKLELTKKELNKIKRDMKEIYDNEVEKDNKRVNKQAGKMQKNMKKYVRDYFFDENIPSDFEDSSSESSLERTTSKNDKQISNGLNVLMNAKRKIDQIAQVRSIINC